MTYGSALKAAVTIQHTGEMNEIRKVIVFQRELVLHQGDFIEFNNK